MKGDLIQEYKIITNNEYNKTSWRNTKSLKIARKIELDSINIITYYISIRHSSQDIMPNSNDDQWSVFGA